MTHTDPKIRAAMQRDRKRAVMRGVITTSTEPRPRQSVFARVRALLPARFRR